jgi:hypothetical protein
VIRRVRLQRWKTELCGNRKPRQLFAIPYSRKIRPVL